MEESLEPRNIASGKRRQLKKKQTQFRAKNGKRACQVGHCVRGYFQPFAMGNLLGRLDGESEVLRGCIPPTLQTLGRGHAIKRGIYFHAAESGRVITEHLPIREVRWIK